MVEVGLEYLVEDLEVFEGLELHMGIDSGIQHQKIENPVDFNGFFNQESITNNQKSREMKVIKKWESSHLQFSERLTSIAM